jgi:hypothetical protein
MLALARSRIYLSVALRQLKAPSVIINLVEAIIPLVKGWRETPLSWAERGSRNKT